MRAGSGADAERSECGSHVGAYLPEKETRTSDLICRVLDTHGRLPDDYSCDRVFELRLEPETERRASETPDALALLLAICIEGFWSAQPLDPVIKYSVGIFFWILLIAYLVFAGRGGIPRSHDGH